MDEAHKELVKRLRIIGPTLPNDKGYSTTVPQAVAIAANALEALAGEVERLTSDVDALGENLEKAIARAEAAEAERDELANWKASFLHENEQILASNAQLAAERDRLKAAITTHVAGCVACGGRGVVFLCPERDDTAEAVREDCEECVGLRKALGDAS